MSSLAAGSLAWLHQFQEIYLKKGVKDTEAQRDFLLGLAKHYEDQFDKTKNWTEAFKAFSLYNANIEESSVMRDDQVCRDVWRVISKYLYDGKDSNEDLHKKQQFFALVESRRRDLTTKRDILRTSLANLSQKVGTQVQDHPKKMKNIVSRSNDMMVSFAGTIIDEAIDFMGANRPPCDFSAVGIGSLGRGEATPYSDLEYLFLIEKAEYRPYFEKLAVLTYFIIGALNETKLNSIDIVELNGEEQRGIEKGWFVDGRQYGYQIDGITSTSDNVPTRAQSLWRLKDSGGFIATPKDLLREYKAVLDSPIPKEALKGDITSMLMFTKLLGKRQYSLTQENSSEFLLSSFVRQRDELNRHRNAMRMKINLEMLDNDLNKFVFHPEYDLYSSGFDMNVKTELYRFPSILLLDLTTIIDDVGSDSWSTLQLIEQKFSEVFADHLARLLIYACFSRLRCYLAMDAHFDSFSVGGHRSFPSGVGDTNQHIGYRINNTWEMSRDEFFLLCRDLITMQRHMKTTKGMLIKTPNEVAAIMSEDILEYPIAITMAHYYCCEWSEVVQSLDGYYGNSMGYQCRIALAFSYMKLDECSKSVKILEDLRDDFLLDKTVDDVIQVNVLRLLAKCSTKIHSDDIPSVKIRKLSSQSSYETAFVAIRALPLDRRNKLRRIEAHALFEYGLYLSRNPEEKSKALDLLYRALQLFIVDAATHPKCSHLRILNNFLYLNDLNKLDWVGNETRELAHCLYSIASLLYHKDVAREYYRKAEKLGLEFFVRFGTDNYTQIMILTDLGKAMDNKQYLRGALTLLEKSCRQKSDPELKTEIMVSIVECIGQASDRIEHSAELEIRLELLLDELITYTNTEGDEFEDDEIQHKSLLHNERTNSWYSRAIKALKDIPTDLTKEETELLRGLKEQFALIGKDTTALEEAIDKPRLQTHSERQSVSTPNGSTQTTVTEINQNEEVQASLETAASDVQTDELLSLPSLREVAEVPGASKQHLGVKCDSCLTESFGGQRFICGSCDFFNLCGECEAKPREDIRHDVTHLFIMLKSPVTRPEGQYQPPTVPLLGRYTEAIKKATTKDASLHSHRKADIECNVCRNIVEGIRYRCGLCGDYDLCESCEDISVRHFNGKHVFIKIPCPLIPNVLKKKVLITDEWLRRV